MFELSPRHAADLDDDLEPAPAPRPRRAPGKRVLTEEVPGRGGPLARFAPAFGIPLDDIRLELGSALARGAGAEAVALGDTIHVAADRLDLDRPDDRALIGHELAHVMQQRAGRVHATGAHDGHAVSRSPDLEAEADQVGARVARGLAAGIAAPGGGPAQAVAQYRVGTGLVAGDPVIIRGQSVEEPVDGSDATVRRPLQGIVVRAERGWGYLVRVAGPDGAVDRVYTLAQLDLVRDHDYGGRSQGKVLDRLIPGTGANLRDAKKPRPADGKESKAKKQRVGGAPHPGTAARGVLRELPRTAFSDMAMDWTQADMLAMLAADSQGPLWDDGSGGPPQHNNLRDLEPLASRFVVDRVTGTVTVTGGMATFVPRHPNQVLPQMRRTGWPGGDAPALEIEVYAYGKRSYRAIVDGARGTLAMEGGKSAARFVRDNGGPEVDGAITQFAADVPGRLQLVRSAAPTGGGLDGSKPSGGVDGGTPSGPVDVGKASAALDGGGKPDGKPPPTIPTVTAKPPAKASETVAVELEAVVVDVLHARDEDGRYYTVTREGDTATLELGSEQARASGKSGGGFATTRTDLAPPSTYVWFGPKPDGEVGGLGGKLAPERWRGPAEFAAEFTYWIEGEGNDTCVFDRTNTPSGSRYLYFKEVRRPLRWFGPPRDGEHIGLRKPDYGGAFTDELTQDQVAAQLAGHADPIAEFARDGAKVKVPGTISVWLLRKFTKPPRLFWQDGDEAPDEERYAKPPQGDRKKVKDRKAQWADGAWSQPPQGWESRPPAHKDRDTMMDGASASAEARRPADDGGLGADLTHPRQEWCHLVGHGDGGSEHASNLAAGSHYANTEQLALEEGARTLRAAGKPHGVVVLLKVTSYLTPGTNCADAIRYKVYLRRNLPGTPASDAAVDSSEPSGPAVAKIFDHLFDGQSDAFDRNQFAIAKQTLLDAGARQFAAWGIEVDVDAEDAADGEAGGGWQHDWGRFASQGREAIAWPTLGDGNCAFNGIAQVLIRLVREGQLTAAAVAAPLELDAPTIAALLPALDPGGDVHALEATLADPLRQLAADQLAADAGRARQLAAVYFEELCRQLALAVGLGGAAAATDLFPADSATAATLAVELDDATAAITADADELGLEEAFGQWCAANGDAVMDRFIDGGLEGYLADMRGDGQYAGAPELAAIAATYGLHLTVFHHAGDGVMALHSEANAGFAPLDETWTAREIAGLATLGLFEGQETPDQTIAFARRTPEEVAELLGHPPEDFVDRYPDLMPQLAELGARYAALRGEHYRHPIEVAMYRHGDMAHWSAVTNGHGNANLDDATERLPDGAAIPELGDGNLGAWSGGWDEPAWGGGWDEAELGGTSPFELTTTADASGHKTGTVAFVQKPATVNGTDLRFAAHRFGRSQVGKPSHGPFQMAQVDPAFAPGQHAAVVNAANPSLHGSAGIALGLQDVAGPKATATWKANGTKAPLAPGGAVADVSGDLATQGVSRVIHTVAPTISDPKWRGVLRQCCASILQAAADQHLDVIILCSLGTGIYGLPADESAQIMVAEITALLAAPPPAWNGWQPARIVFNNFPGAPPPVHGQPGKADPSSIDPFPFL